MVTAPPPACGEGGLCRCNLSRKQIDCHSEKEDGIVSAGLNLTFVPQLPPWVQRLELDKNPIPFVSRGSWLGAPELREITINECRISELINQPFGNIQNTLLQLKIDRPQILFDSVLIEKVHIDTFSTLPNLLTLALSGQDQIDFTPELLNIPSLKLLQCSACQNIWKPGILQNLVNLHEIIFGFVGFNFRTIPAGVLQSPTVEKVSLIANDFRSVQSKFLRSSTGLTCCSRRLRSTQLAPTGFHSTPRGRKCLLFP